VNISNPVRRKWFSQIVPCVPATSSRRSMPPRKVHETSNWPMAPDSKRMSAIALSSSAMGWTSVSVWHMTSIGRLPLPTKLRMISMQWHPRSMIGPPPVRRPSQNHAECGPGCVSRERTQVTSPIAPSRTALTALSDFGV
jgi:hypothetical protein